MVISLILGLLLNDISGKINTNITDNYAGQVQVVDFQTLPEASTRRPQKLIVEGKESIGIDITARSAIVVDVVSGDVLFEKNNKDQFSIASLTKLMTALVFIENNPGWDKEVVLQQSDEREGAQAHIYRGESVSIRDLFFTSLIGSDNNSTVALVRSSGKSMEEFVDLMNKKAQEIGLEKTTFVDPTGLEDGNISSAYDISKLIYHAMRSDDIQSATQKSSYQIKIRNKNANRTIFNTDVLLESYINKKYKILGGKTGFTPLAGSCLGIQVEGDFNNPIIVVVMGSRDNTMRFKEVKALTQWAFDNYQWN